MVYESDFYTTRRPYSRPTVTSYSVTVYPHIPYIAHKKLAMVTPSAHGWRVNKSVLLGEIDRIYHKVRPSLAYQPMEDYLNSPMIVSFDDETRSIRAQTAELLKKIYTPIPRAQRPLPLTGDAYYSHSELPITDRITSDHYIDRLLSANRDVHHNVLTRSYYDEPARRYAGIGKGHLACVTFAGGRPISRRRNLAVPHDNIRNDITVLSHYGRFRAAAAASSVPEQDYIPIIYQAPTKSPVTGSWKSNAPLRTGSDKSDKSLKDGYRPRELKAGAEFDAALERKKKRREALEAAALKEAQEEKRRKQEAKMQEELAEKAELEREEQEKREKEEAERMEQERLEAERKAKEEEERKAKEEAERKAKEEEERKAKEEEERKAREEAERKAKEEAERKAKEEAERKAKEEAERKAEEERKAKEEAERLAKEEEERKAKEEAERLAKEEEERKAKEEAERLAKEEEERLANEEADQAEETLEEVGEEAPTELEKSKEPIVEEPSSPEEPAPESADEAVDGQTGNQEPEEELEKEENKGEEVQAEGEEEEEEEEGENE